MAQKKIVQLITIVTRGMGAKVISVCDSEHCAVHLSFMGHGTAPTKLLDYLGLGASDKDIIFSIVPAELSKRILARLNDELKLSEDGNGIAFTVPVSSVGGPITLQLLSGANEKGE